MKTIEMKDLKVGDLFTSVIQGRGRQSFTALEVGLKQLTCIETVDVELVHNKKVKETKKRIFGYVYLLKRQDDV